MGIRDQLLNKHDELQIKRPFSRSPAINPALVFGIPRLVCSPRMPGNGNMPTSPDISDVAGYIPVSMMFVLLFW